MLVCLVVLTITFFLLTLYSILQVNADLLPNGTNRFFTFKILDTASAASLFVTLLGALLVRHQFALSLLPRINYKSGNATRIDSANPNLSLNTWRVELLNSGLGAAVVNNTKYDLALSGERKSCLAVNHRCIVDALDQVGLIRGSDYWLENITTGFALSPKETCPVFEIKVEHLTMIKRLDMQLQFQDQLGGRYGREIFLVPHQVAESEK